MNKILFIDTVTTGMNVKRCAIYKIGGIFTENGKETERIELNVKPFAGAEIQTGSIAVSGETLYEISRHPSEQDAYQLFIKTLMNHVNPKNPNDKLYLGGFNVAAFDYPFLREWFVRMSNNRFRDYFHVQTIDLLSLSAFYLMNERSNMPDFHLETAASFLGIVPTISKTYSCLNNAKTCLDMYRTLILKMHIGFQPDDAVTENLVKNF